MESRVDRNWQWVEGRLVADHIIFRVRHDIYRRLSDGLTHEFVLMECPDWVNILPFTADGRLILVRQFRHGIGGPTWEIPGGVLEPDEPPEQGAQRELREETGHVPEKLELLARIHPNPAFQANTCHLFLATGCRPVAAQHLDPTEELELAFFPFEQVCRMILAGEITHSLVLSTFLEFILRKCRVEPPRH
jgi:8-oxo-dGTP pyrophosphatase MutT (NUDIX family)